MATNIASLNINLFARTDTMLAGLRRAQSGIKSFGASVRAIGAGVSLAVGLIGGPLAGLAGGAGVVALTRDALKAGDQLGKTADQIGIATERLAQLEFAAGLAGVESTDLAKGLARLARSSAQAAQGLSEPKRAFEQLGLDAAAIASLPVDEQLIRVAAALQRVDNVSQRIDIVQSLFGRGGVPLLSLLAQGEEKLRAQAQEATNLGLAIRRVDAASFEEANDAVSKIGSALRGVGNEVATQFAPLIEFAADNVTSSIADLRPVLGYVSRVAGDVTQDLFVGFSLVASVIANLGDILDLVGTKFVEVGSRASSFLASGAAGLARAAGRNTLATALNAFSQVTDLSAQATSAKASEQLNSLFKSIGTDVDAMRALFEQARATSPVAPGASGAFDLNDDENTQAVRENTAALERVERRIDDLGLSNASLANLQRDVRELAFAARTLNPTGRRSP